MSVIDLKAFGGIMPAVNKRRLPADSAQAALNLDPRYGDFRPMATDGPPVTAVAAGVRTLFKTPNTGTWLSTVNVASYVRGLLKDDPVERVYLTGRNTYPEAWQAGSYRRLGVPPPTAAPTVTFTSRYDPYIASERADDIEINLVAGVATAIRDSLQPLQWIGAADSFGMTQWTIANGFSNDNHPQLLYGQAAAGETIIDSQNKGWLLDPRLDGFWGPGGAYYCIPVHAYGYWQEVDGAVLGTKLQAFYRPRGPATGDQLFTSQQISDLQAAVAAYLDSDSPQMMALKGRMTALVTAFHGLVSTGHDPAMADAVAKFYLRAEVTAEIDKAAEALAGTVVDQLDAAYTYDPNPNPGGA